MIRELIFKISRSLTERVVPSRKDFHVPVKICFESKLQTGKLQMPSENLTITGETSDLSKTGIGFLVSSVRIREKYLVGEGNLLNAELDLPTGSVQMQIIGRRYIQVGKRVSTAKYLIGAEIVKMTAENREIYERFLNRKENNIKADLSLRVDEA